MLLTQSYQAVEQNRTLHYNASQQQTASHQQVLSPEHEEPVNNRSSYSEYRFSSTSVSLSQGQSDGQNHTYSNITTVRHSALLINTNSEVKAVEEAPEPLAATQNILRFIEQGVSNAIARGASEEQAQFLLTEGLRGFEEGFAQAKQQIDAIGLLNSEVAETLAAVHNEVTDGIAQLQATLHADSEPAIKPVPVAIAPVEPATTVNATNSSIANQKAAIEQITRLSSYDSTQSSTLSDSERAINESVTNNASKIAATTEIDYQRKNSFQFTLETSDGDIVNISAASEFSASGRYNYSLQQSQYGLQESANSQEASHQFQAMRFSIEGELDDDEVAAIDALLGKVMNLADQFYNGDVEGAYNAALELGYDRDEIASYAINLTQVETQRVASAYQRFAPTTATSPLIERLQPLSDFSAQLIDTLTQEQSPLDIRQLLPQLIEQLDQQHENKAILSFSDATADIMQRFVNT